MTPTLNERTDAWLAPQAIIKEGVSRTLDLLREWRTLFDALHELHAGLLQSAKEDYTTDHVDRGTAYHDAAFRVALLIGGEATPKPEAAPAPASRSDEAQSVEPQTDWRKTELDIARADGWREAVIAAREGARLIPPDGKDGLHNFAAQTVLKAVEASARRMAGVRFADDPDDAMARILERMAEAPSATGVLVERADLEVLCNELNNPQEASEETQPATWGDDVCTGGWMDTTKRPSHRQEQSASEPGRVDSLSHAYGEGWVTKFTVATDPTALDEAWAQIKASSSPPTHGGLYSRDYIRAIDHALEILTRLGATDAAWRK